MKCLSNKDSFTILEILFDRLYTLRNQILHGSSTWNSDINRDKVNDRTKIISYLIPNFVSIMMLNYKQNWGSLAYPIIEA